MGKRINKVGKGGGLFAKVDFHDGVHLPIYGLYACNFYHSVIDHKLMTEIFTNGY
ncbi:MAG TPA: hypothetical protein HA261_10975 [Methanosarcina sp.]|nr:hypothetical protein [Methanosarcina sp.]